MQANDEPAYTGECINCMTEVTGTPIRARPEPYWDTLDPFGRGEKVKVRLVTDANGCLHDIVVGR